MSHPRKRKARKRKAAQVKPSGLCKASEWGASVKGNPRVFDEHDTAPLSMDLLAPRPQYQHAKACNRGGGDFATSTNYTAENRKIGTTQ